MATKPPKVASVSDDSAIGSRVDLADAANSLMNVLAKLYVSGRREDVERRAAGQLSNTQYAILRLVAERGCIRVSELAHAAGVTLSTMSVTVSRLTRRGLICRPSPTPDRRNSCVALTKYGAWVYETATQARRQSLQARVQRLSRDDQQSLSGAVAVLRRMVDDHPAAAGDARTELAGADGV